jgi:hypothetical protein
MRIVVTSYRHWQDRAAVFKALDYWDRMSGFHLKLGVGDCPTGGDAFARQWAWERGRMHETKVYPANWDLFAKGAGPLRNQWMIDDFDPMIVLAFLHPESKGARGCAEYARRKGITVLDKWEGRDGSERDHHTTGVGDSADDGAGLWDQSS